MHFSASTLLALASSVAAHGLIKSPYPRAVGAASLAACGSAVTKIITADNTSHVEGLPETAATDSGYKAADCNLWLCKGLQYADNTANVLSLSEPSTATQYIHSNSAYSNGECEYRGHKDEYGNWGRVEKFSNI